MAFNNEQNPLPIVSYKRHRNDKYKTEPENYKWPILCIIIHFNFVKRPKIDQAKVYYNLVTSHCVSC